jgi:membrane protease YdiL (CAAX protease family)
MDKKSVVDILFFLFVFNLIILPPLFVQNASSAVFTTWSFPVQPFIYAVIAGMIFLNFYKKNSNKKYSSTLKQITIFIDSGYTLFTFGFLCVIAAGIEFFFQYRGLQSSITPVRPSCAIQYLFCILDFAFASFFEEVIYRLYLPDTLTRFISTISRINPRVVVIISESASVLFFAFAHRYLGTPSIVNAALACIILRACCKKSGTVWTNTAAHFAYNMFSLILFTAV